MDSIEKKHHPCEHVDCDDVCMLDSKDDHEARSYYDDCPKCGKSYDDADMDFQICHFCQWDAENSEYVKE